MYSPTGKPCALTVTENPEGWEVSVGLVLVAGVDPLDAVDEDTLPDCGGVEDEVDDSEVLVDLVDFDVDCGGVYDGLDEVGTPLLYSLIELDAGPRVPVRINKVSQDFLCLCVLLERIHAAESLGLNITADLDVSLTDNGGFYVPEQDSIDVPPVLDRYQLTSGSFSMQFDNFDRSSYQRFFRKLLGLFKNTNPSGGSPFLELSQNRLDQWLRAVGSSTR
jgi:hypothetical protein